MGPGIPWICLGKPKDKTQSYELPFNPYTYMTLVPLARCLPPSKYCKTARNSYPWPYSFASTQNRHTSSLKAWAISALPVQGNRQNPISQPKSGRSPQCRVATGECAGSSESCSKIIPHPAKIKGRKYRKVSFNAPKILYEHKAILQKY